MGQAQKGLNHFLHLGFTCAPVANDGQFCFFRGKFVDGDAASCGSEVDHPLGHSELECALNIFEDELTLDCHRIGTVPLQKGLYPIKNDFVPLP